jgi:hypothetical protein
VPPNQAVAGQSQLFWAQALWQWLLGIPVANSPLLDATGANAEVHNNGPVFFLAGNGGGDSARTIDVPYGRPVFFPVIDEVFAGINPETGNYDPSPCPSPLTVQCAVQQISGFVSAARNMAVEIDRKTLNNSEIQKYRQTSAALFAVKLPGNNLFGAPIQNYNRCCVSLPIWAEDGYYVTLTNLSPGVHLLHFHTESSTFILDVTDKLNVVSD